MMEVLYLLVQQDDRKNITKSWLFRCVRDKKDTIFNLGPLLLFHCLRLEIN